MDRPTEIARSIAHEWCVSGNECFEDTVAPADSESHSAECDMLTEQIASAVRDYASRQEAETREAQPIETAPRGEPILVWHVELGWITTSKADWWTWENVPTLWCRLPSAPLPQQ